MPAKHHNGRKPRARLLKRNRIFTHNSSDNTLDKKCRETGSLRFPSHHLIATVSSPPLMASSSHWTFATEHLLVGCDEKESRHKTLEITTFQLANTTTGQAFHAFSCPEKSLYQSRCRRPCDPDSASLGTVDRRLRSILHQEVKGSEEDKVLDCPGLPSSSSFPFEWSADTVSFQRRVYPIVDRRAATSIVLQESTWPKLRMDLHVRSLHVVVIVEASGMETTTKSIAGVTETIVPDATLTPMETWTSTRSMRSYTTAWKLVIPSLGLDLCLEDSVPRQQEIINLTTMFHCARLTVSPACGAATVLTRPEALADLSSFFSLGMPSITRQELRRFLPSATAEDVSCADVARVVSSARPGSDWHGRFVSGVDPWVFDKTMIAPLRDLLARGGKAWRAYLFLLCIDAVGGRSEDHRRWVVLPEIMHTGSLIIDDIEDESVVRRGGPTCHVVHGTNVALNAGCNAYFLAMSMVDQAAPTLSPEIKCAIYEDLHVALRAGHTGQGMDILGVDHLLNPSADGLPNTTALLQHVRTTHRLKTGAFAAVLAKIAVVLGGGTCDQARCMSDYFEEVGLAFQMVDDVINVRDRSSSKHGEDIKMGKFTDPMVKHMAKITKAEDCRRFTDGIRARPQDITTIERLCSEMEGSGALVDSETDARQIVDEAWKKLSPVLPMTFFKIMLRALGLFVLSARGGGGGTA